MCCAGASYREPIGIAPSALVAGEHAPMSPNESLQLPNAAPSLGMYNSIPRVCSFCEAAPRVKREVA